MRCRRPACTWRRARPIWAPRCAKRLAVNVEAGV
jgi:hypothetical protein